MKIVEELRAKATIAKQNKDEKAERLALDSIISMFAWRNDHMWEIADYLYFKKLEKSLKDSSSETTRHLISKMNK